MSGEMASASVERWRGIRPIGARMVSGEGEVGAARGRLGVQVTACHGVQRCPSLLGREAREGIEV